MRWEAPAHLSKVRILKKRLTFTLAFFHTGSNYFAAIMIVATSMPKLIIKDKTSYSFMLTTALSQTKRVKPARTTISSNHYNIYSKNLTLFYNIKL